MRNPTKVTEEALHISRVQTYSANVTTCIWNISLLGLEEKIQQKKIHLDYMQIAA